MNPVAHVTYTTSTGQSVQLPVIAGVCVVIPARLVALDPQLAWCIDAATAEITRRGRAEGFLVPLAEFQDVTSQARTNPRSSEATAQNGSPFQSRAESTSTTRAQHWRSRFTTTQARDASRDAMHWLVAVACTLVAGFATLACFYAAWTVVHAGTTTGGIEQVVEALLLTLITWASFRRIYGVVRHPSRVSRVEAFLDCPPVIPVIVFGLSVLTIAPILAYLLHA